MIASFWTTVLGILGLVFLTWVVIFGGLGLLLARSRGGNPVIGLVLGVLAGPIGWGIVMFLTRESRRPVALDDWVDDPVASSDDSPAPATGADQTAFGGHDF